MTRVSKSVLEKDISIVTLAFEDDQIEVHSSRNMEGKVDDNIPDVQPIKVYKEKPYLNSNKDPFGLTIKGKTKGYIAAHKSVQAMVVKGKAVATAEGKFKVLDASHNKGMINAILEVCSGDVDKGTVELKVYDPRLDKKKGATIEMRKMADSDYNYVEKLRNIVTCLLDKFLSGESKRKTCVGVTGEQKFYTCDICDWQTRFEPALKGHKKRLHSKIQNPNLAADVFPCIKCEFKTKSKSTLMVHNRMNHKEETAKRSKVTLQCKKYNCESTFDNQEKLKEHTKKQHEEPEIIQTLETESPSSSPPRKKLEKQIEENNSDMLDLDNMEIKIEKELNINFLLERRIKELEEIKLKESSRIQELEIMVTSLLEEKAKDEEFKLTLKRNIEELKAQSTFKIPKHLSGVHVAHLQKLRGFKMIYKTLGNG